MIVHERELPQRLLVQHGALLTPIAEAQELALRLGCSDLEPPAECSDGADKRPGSAGPRS